jgi:pre-rRNA-processing protein TSR4
MADYDSDSSGAGDDIETNVLLGYASKDPTGDEFSQLGGQPVCCYDKLHRFNY